MKSSAVFIGIKGSVIAIDRATGQELWATGLKGSDFVNVMLDEDRVLAATQGELFCLDGVTGKVLWNNTLPGQGHGIITIATSNGSTGMGPLRKRQSDQEQASATAVIATSQSRR